MGHGRVRPAWQRADSTGAAGSAGGWDQGVHAAGIRFADERDIVSVSRFGYLGSTLPAGATTTMQADAYAQLLDALAVDRADVLALSAAR